MKNEPAFPIPATDYHGMDSGMTLRDYFAAKAMQGELASGDASRYAENIASRSYAIADAMLKARE